MQRIIVWGSVAILAVCAGIVVALPSPCAYDWRECADVYELVRVNETFDKAQRACKQAADAQVAGRLNWPDDPFAEPVDGGTMSDDGRFAYMESRTDPTIVCGYDMTSGEVTSIRTGR